MRKHMKQIMISIVVVLLLLIAVLFFIPNTGITSLVTGHATAVIIPQIHPLFDEDKVIMRVSNPSCTGLGCNVDNWYSTVFSSVILNSNPIRPADSTYNPHTCRGQNQIGYVVNTPVSEFYSYDSANPPPSSPSTSDVCYSEFECEICNTRTSPTCATLTTEGYDCYFSVMSLDGNDLLNGKVRPCGTTPGYDYMCRDCAVKCPTHIQDRFGVMQPFTACVDDGSHMCCADYTNSCMYGNACYTEGDTIMMDGNEMICSNQHWCPDGDGYTFTYDPTLDACVPYQEACYSSTNSDYCNYNYPGIGLSTDPYWSDLSGTYPCIDEPADDPTIADSKACCDVTISMIDYYFYQDNVETESTGLLQSVNICGDTYNVDTASDGMCLSAAPYDDSCTPGYFNDPDCCGQCGWICDDVSELCGDGPNEYWQDELDSTGNTITTTTSTEVVLDVANEGACVSDLTNCADDYDEYFDYSGSGPCVEGNDCRNIDNTNADLEVCDAGVWHDPDESAVYCDAVNIFDYNVYWTTTDEGGYDDYDNDKTNGYCYGDDGFTIYGEVTDPAGDSIQGASFAFQYVSNNALIDEGLSDIDGYFQANVLQGFYNIVVEKEGYLPYTEANFELVASQPMNFELALSSECQSDCTTNDGYCHAECDGVNGCTFSPEVNLIGETVVDVCDGKGEGWVRDFDTTTHSDGEVLCCVGSPQAASAIVSAAPAPNDDILDVYTSTRLVNVGGQTLTLNIVVWSE
jgi:hypothetical protein